MNIDHRIFPSLLRRKVKMLIIGAGGTGSAFLLNLVDLHQALLAWGHPGALDVCLADGDKVSETNCVRQAFARSDVGQNKATILINRVNLFYGFKWRAVPEFFSAETFLARSTYDSAPDIVVGCVDSRAARREIERYVTSRSARVPYYLDLGNGSATGQFVLGQPLNAVNRRGKERLRTVGELYPESLAEGEDPQPSCSAQEALESQEPYVNKALVIPALSMLTRLFRYGQISYQGGFWNAESGRLAPLTYDPEKRRREKNRRLVAIPVAA